MYVRVALITRLHGAFVCITSGHESCVTPGTVLTRTLPLLWTAHARTWKMKTADMIKAVKKTLPTPIQVLMPMELEREWTEDVECTVCDDCPCMNRTDEEYTCNLGYEVECDQLYSEIKGASYISRDCRLLYVEEKSDRLFSERKTVTIVHREYKRDTRPPRTLQAMADALVEQSVTESMFDALRKPRVWDNKWFSMNDGSSERWRRAHGKT